MNTYKRLRKSAQTYMELHRTARRREIGVNYLTLPLHNFCKSKLDLNLHMYNIIHLCETIWCSSFLFFAFKLCLLLVELIMHRSEEGRKHLPELPKTASVSKNLAYKVLRLQNLILEN